MADQMRGDCLGIAGHPDVKTPYLDSLGATGVMFDHAYTACPSCIPARAALHTGMSQRHHGRVGYQDLVEWKYPHTLAGSLAKGGYYTECIGKMHVHPLRSMMGFHHIELHDGYLHAYRNPSLPWQESQKQADDYYYWLKNELGIEADVIDTGIDCNSWLARPWIYEEKYHPTNWVSTRAIDFLRRRDPSMPFFLMASYVRPHPPFDAPACYFDMYKEKPLAGPAIGDWEEQSTDLIHDLEKKGRIYDSATGPSDPELIRQAQVGYYACITHLDHQIGRLLLALREQNLLDNTVILFTSDHGEALCDHHLFRKSRPYEGSSHIPMILTGPKNLTGASPGTVCHQLVELRDVMPTLLDLGGCSIPKTVDGASMLDLCRDPGTPIREFLCGEHSIGIHSNHFVVTAHDKFIWYSQTGQEQYFDLITDRKELHNSIHDPDKQNRITLLRNILIEELKGREEGYSDGTQLITGRPPQAVLKQAGL